MFLESQYVRIKVHFLVQETRLGSFAQGQNCSAPVFLFPECPSFVHSDSASMCAGLYCECLVCGICVYRTALFGFVTLGRRTFDSCVGRILWIK